MGWHKGPKVNQRRWELVRLEALDRDGWRCGTCGRYGNEGDHITPLFLGGAVYDLDNIQCLCKSCHLAKSLAERGSAPSPEQVAWREYLRGLTGRR